MACEFYWKFNFAKIDSEIRVNMKIVTMKPLCFLDNCIQKLLSVDNNYPHM